MRGKFIKKLEKSYINADSPEYKQYRKVITHKYQLFPIFLVISLAMLILFFLNRSSGLDYLFYFFLILALFAFSVGERADNRKFIYQNMLTSNAEKKINAELLERIRKERQKRIRAAILGVRLIVWLFSFFILDSIADSIRGALNIHTAQDYAFIILMIIILSTVIFVINKVIYWIASIITRFKYVIIDYINHGMFVEYYTTLTIIDKGLDETYFNN